MYFWCQEAKSIGLLIDFKFHPKTIQLTEGADFRWSAPYRGNVASRIGTNVENKWNCFMPHVYTPDFEVTWNVDMARRTVGVTDGDLRGTSVSWIGSVFFMASSGKKGTNEYILAHPDQGSFKTLFEVKPSFNKNKRSLSSVYKSVWNTHGEYVHECNISTKAGSFFDRTWTPTRYLLTDKTAKPRKLHYRARTVHPFFEVAKIS